MRMDLRRFRLSLKNMRFWFWIPFVLIFLLLPSMQSQILRMDVSIEIKKLEFFASAQNLLPLSGMLWLFLFFREFMESTVREVLYAADRWPKVRFIGYLFVFHQIAATPLYIWYIRVFAGSGLELFRLSLQTLFLYAAFYLVLFLTRSTLTAFAFALLGCAMMLFQWNRWEPTNLFANMLPAAQVPPSTFWLYAKLSVLFVLGGFWFELHYRVATK
jgi:hypothetical protein